MFGARIQTAESAYPYAVRKTKRNLGKSDRNKDVPSSRQFYNVINKMKIRNDPFQPTEYTNDSLATPILEENNIRERRQENLKDLLYI